MRRLPRPLLASLVALFASCGESPVDYGWDFPKRGVSVCYRECVRNAPDGHVRLDTLSTFDSVGFQGIANSSWLGRQIYKQLIDKPYRYTPATVRLWLVVTAEGKTTHVALLEHSGTPEIDRLTVDVMSHALWHPVTWGGDPVAVAFPLEVPVN